MPTWILIMTMVAGGSGGSVATAPGFASLDACQAAGTTWKADIDANHTWGRINSRFVCVATSK